MIKKRKQSEQGKDSDQALVLLDEMLTKYFRILLEKMEEKPKLGDWLKMIALRQKLRPDEKPQAELWKKLDQVRQDLLGESGGIKHKTVASTSANQINRRKKETDSNNSR